jgi:hypothetical protein
VRFLYNRSNASSSAMAREQAGRQKAEKKHPGAGPRNGSAGSNISTARTSRRGFRGGVVAGFNFNAVAAQKSERVMD